MSERVINAYAHLARAYDDAGFSNYATSMTPQIIEYLQKDAWVGRRILDLGCGTGSSTAFLGNVRMQTWGVDISADMLKVAKMRVMDMDHVELIEGDMRAVNFPPELDLVLCIGNALNELASLRDVAIVLKKSFDALQPGRRVVFDLLTPRGLGEYLGTQQQIIEVSDDIFMTVEGYYNYGQVALKQAFNIFTQQGGQWSRGTSFLALKGYTQDSIEQILEKIGYQVVSVVDSSFAPFKEEFDREGRMIFVCEKPAAS